jgi:hypothetical protein
VTGASPTERPPLPEVDPRAVVAEIWATVDLDRALAALGQPWEALPDDPLLGASVRLVRRAEGPLVALVEPTTEGPLSATLARYGEGPIGRYVAAVDGLAAAIRELAARDVRVSRPADGPFGRSVLVLAGSIFGPHLILVERPAGTIDR